MSRSVELLRNTPLATLGIIMICTLIFILQNALNWNLQVFTFCPRLIIYAHEYYRVFTSMLFHANMMHIGMNMLSTYAIGRMLEKQLGTLGLVVTMLWSAIISCALYLCIAMSAHLVFDYDKWMYDHAVGFSGVLFHFSVLECHLSPQFSRSLFGVVNVPSALYPWALLVVLQMFMPNLSFLGHLSGILAGSLQIEGHLEWIMPGDSYLREMESWTLFRQLAGLPSFHSPPSSGTVGGSRFGRSESGGILRFAKKGVTLVFKYLYYFVETLAIVIFGRGHQPNSNIRFDDLWLRPKRRAAEPGVISRPIDVLQEADDEEDEENQELSPLI
ncbi:unnamed protein product [Cylindrotheca closterium]|uniref:Peptidase S54 rhomboid domain-containing protein n=1 Tax=Cylindrotheca closterium TaxID=2856 RepID=A0AAD2PUT7_9STRA|nr:unnamed protein product [Cylindrotheca closterium]